MPEGPASRLPRAAWAVPAVLLGGWLLAGLLGVAVLSWRAELRARHAADAATAGLGAARIAAALETESAALLPLAGTDASTWNARLQAGGVPGLRPISVSRLDADGRVLASSNPRNIGQDTGQALARAGTALPEGQVYQVAAVFAGRDLAGRRALGPDVVADFLALVLADPHRTLVATLPLRDLEPLLGRLVAVGDDSSAGLYWQDGTRLRVAGRRGMPDTLEAAARQALHDGLSWQARRGDGALLSCQPVAATPLMLCLARSLPGPLSALQDLPRAGLAAVLAAMLAALLLSAAAWGRRRRSRHVAPAAAAAADATPIARALAAMGGLVWQADAGLRQVSYQGATGLLGDAAPRERLITLLDRLDPADAPALRAALAAGREFALTVRLAGSRPTRSLRMCGSPGAAGWVGAICDITDIIATDRRYHGIFRTLSEAVLVADAHGAIEEANPAAEALFGVDPGALEGQPIGAVLGYWPHAGNLQPDDLPAGGTRECSARRLDGELLPVLVSTAGQELGGARRIVLVLHDLRGKRAMEARLRAATDTAERAEQVKSDFIATVSHELRTPLNGLLGMLALLQQAELPAPDRDQLGHAVDCARQLRGLVNDLLDLSRIEQGLLHIKGADFELAALLRELETLFLASAAQKGLELAIETAPGLPARLHGDAARLRQVMVNLLGNAIRFTQAGSVTLRLDAVPDGAALLLRGEVEDTGIGIPVHAQGLLFQRFAPADAAAGRRVGGTGLGLAITRELCRMMGGDISVQSIEGVGSCFRFTVRLAPALSEQPPPPPPSDLHQALGLTVLVADDNATNRQVLQRLLSLLGCRAVLSEDGAQAVEAVQQHQLDAVLMDLHMPEMDGLSATRLMRERGARMPIIGVSANAMVHARAACIDAGMDDYLVKPIDLAALARLLGRLCQPSAAQAQDLPQAPAADAGPPHLDLAQVAELQRLLGGALPKLWQGLLHKARTLAAAAPAPLGSAALLDLRTEAASLGLSRLARIAERLHATSGSEAAALQQALAEAAEAASRAVAELQRAQV